MTGGLIMTTGSSIFGVCSKAAAVRTPSAIYLFLGDVFNNKMAAISASVAQ